MKVKELIELLQGQDPEAEVILQKDAEGNGYSPLAGADPSLYRADTTYSGEPLHPDDIEDGYYDDADLAAAVAAIVLWPIN